MKNTNKRQRKHSIKGQLVFRGLLLIVAAMVGSWFLNVFLLERLYTRQKIRQLDDVYEIIYKYKDNLESDEFIHTITKKCQTNNINFMVVNPEEELLVTSINNPLKNRDIWNEIEQVDKKNKGIIKKSKKYNVANVYDSQDDITYITLYGQLTANQFFVVRTARIAVRNIVSLSNTIMICVNLGAIIFGFIVMNMIARRISKPVVELTQLSQRMAQLDFDAKYESKNIKEIDILGENFNQMSDILEENIRNLKNANSVLQNDIENKNRIDQLRTEFIANVSHELKTPIALIQGYAEGLKEGIGDDPESFDFYCNVIIDETARMNRLVRQLITLTQLEYNSGMIDYQRFDICEVIRNCIAVSDIIAKEKGVTINIDIADSLYVWSDEYLVEQVIRNYYSNALNHVVNDGTIKVSIISEMGKARISVYNDGEPIPDESIDYIWDKFYKIDKARSREYGGTGIGLSIVKATMDSLNEKYGVINHENGVEFWFEVDTNCSCNECVINDKINDNISE